jgi:methylmalonyl-CoA mutase
MLQPELNLIDDFPPQAEDAFLAALRQSLGADASPEQFSSLTEDSLVIRALHTQADSGTREAVASQPCAPLPWEIRPDEVGAGSSLEQQSAAAFLLRDRRANGSAPDAITASLGLDPLGALAATGEIAEGLDVALDRLAAFAQHARDFWPGVRAARASNRPYHLAGSTACQDIAFTLATALTYLRRLETAGFSLRDAACQIEFSFHLDCRFFEATAMLRAARLLWRQMLAQAGLAGADLEAARLRLHVQTGARVLTRRDPWVNLLRNTACCLAGALAGAEAITTTPHDAASGEASDFAQRLAQNTQRVLQQESRLDRVADPAAGAWFLERLTRDMAAKAWGLVQQIEAAGGMAQALQSGLIHELIKPARSERRERLENKEQLITGVTAYANPDEELPPLPPLTEPEQVRELPSEVVAFLEEIGVKPASAEPTRIEPLPRERLAEPFEDLAAPSGQGGAA